TGYTNVPGAVNNVVSSSISVRSLNYTAMSDYANQHFYTTQISPGATLTVGGLGGTPALVAGDVPWIFVWNNTYGLTNSSSITGAGSLNVNSTASLISVGTYNGATLDISGLSSLAANVKQIWVGVTPDNPYNGPNGWLMLARTNNITTTPGSTA